MSEKHTPPKHLELIGMKVPGIPYKIEAERMIIFNESIGVKNLEEFKEPETGKIRIHPAFANVIMRYSKGSIRDFNLKDGSPLIKVFGLLLHTSQEYEFVKPVYAGDEVTTEMVIEEIYEKRNRLWIFFKYITRNQDDEIVLITRSSVAIGKGGY